MINKDKKIAAFNPDDVALAGSNIFGLPFTAEESEIILIPVPWEVTVSYSVGTAQAPEAILKASHQVDLFHLFHESVWKQGIYMEPVSEELKDINRAMRSKAEKYLAELVTGKLGKKARAWLEEVNAACHYMNDWVRQRAMHHLNQGRLVGVVGGDHSTPLGLIQALSQVHSAFSILQVDAHCDLRQAYEGFMYSHASVMFNAVQLRPVTNLVQVGVRDLCAAEYDFIEKSGNRVACFHNEYLSTEKFSGRSWKSLVDTIVSHLGEAVYISFDIDGLEPSYCPHTGTPVPGGLTYNEAVYLIRRVVESGRKIIGFDLNEVGVGPTEWDANVGARVLFELCAWTGISRQKNPSPQVSERKRNRKTS
ncbi:MAG: agmatinase family protein [Flavobacteriales bacterium]|nr:agmatinase family protein [Flavobacteriales bacterium]